MEKITSRNNEKVKAAALLVSSSRERWERGLFVLEGARLSADAAENGFTAQEAYFTAAAMQKYPRETAEIVAHSLAVYEITDEVAARISDTKTPQGVFAVHKTLDKSLFTDKIKGNGIFVALENIQNPANLGAVCRTAEALGLDGVIVGGGCDIYNPKTLRAAMGAIFRLNVIKTENLPQLLKECARVGMQVLASVPDADAQDITRVKTEGSCVCVIGNEGSGLSEEILSVCTSRVTIPMRGRAESLNAAAAAAILMWELVR